MLNRRTAALLLAAALALTLCGVSVFAADPPDLDQESSAGPQSGQAAGNASVSETVPATPLAPGETEEAKENLETNETAPPVELVPDQVGTLSFSNLDSRMRENNFSLLGLEETIASIEVIDYDKMTEDIRDQLNQIGNLQWMLTVSGNSVASDSLKKSYDALRSTFDDLKDGKLQGDNAAVVCQLKNAQKQMVMAGESLYIALTELEQNDQSLGRALTALDRTIQELELRYKLGQISALTLQESKAGRTSLVSSRQTLEMNVANYKLQLEQMIGGELSGTIQLKMLPQVSGKELETMDQETDLATAKEKSYELFAAKRTLADAKTDFEDVGEDYNYNTKKYQYVSAQHTWQAAQYTYNANVQSFENKFRTLYLQVKDDQQVLEAAKTALACEKDTYASVQLKYEQGSVSKNKLLDAADKVSTAQEKADSAAIDLFSAYNNYRWAMDHGILN